MVETVGKSIINLHFLAYFVLFDNAGSGLICTKRKDGKFNFPPFLILTSYFCNVNSLQVLFLFYRGSTLCMNQIGPGNHNALHSCFQCFE